MDDFNIVGMICEHIREESRSKTTLLGVYNDIVNVPKVPGAFATLGIYVRVHLGRNFPVEDLTLIFKPIDGEPIELGTMDSKELARAEQADADDPAPFTGVIMSVNMAPVPIPNEGRMTVIVRLNGKEHVATALKVRVRPVKEGATESSSASEQPALQSPPASPQT